MFLWRTGENYPIIITRYSSLTSSLCHILHSAASDLGIPYLLMPDCRNTYGEYEGQLLWLIRMHVWLVIRRLGIDPRWGLTTFFHGDLSWNIFYCHSVPSIDSRRVFVSFSGERMYTSTCSSLTRTKPVQQKCC